MGDTQGRRARLRSSESTGQWEDGEQQLELKMRAVLISKQVNKDGKEEVVQEKKDFHRDMPEGIHCVDKRAQRGRIGRGGLGTAEGRMEDGGSAAVRCHMGG